MYSRLQNNVGFSTTAPVYIRDSLISRVLVGKPEFQEERKGEGGILKV
jgi:hypothetical protein